MTANCHPGESRDPEFLKKPATNCHPGESRDPESLKKSTIITLTFNLTHLTGVEVRPGHNMVLTGSSIRVDDALDDNDAKTQLIKYFSNPKHKFTLPLNPHGTDFQQRVWKALQELPPGQTLTYGELAEKLNSHPRAVGQACRKNPIPIIIPCHRVVGKNDLGGYSGEQEGDLMDFKKQLLQHEGAL